MKLTRMTVADKQTTVGRTTQESVKENTCGLFSAGLLSEGLSYVG